MTTTLPHGPDEAPVSAGRTRVHDLGRVLVLAGGLSHERDVSLRSGRRVADALRSVGVDVTVSDVDAALLPAIRDDRPDVVFPVLHGSAGEDGALSGVLELLGLPYVGSAPTACRSAFDKPVAKSVVEKAGLRTPASTALPHAMFRELGAGAVLDAMVAQLGLPVVVKPARGGSALGVSTVHDVAALRGAMVQAFAYGDTALVERYVDGIEVAVAVVDTGSGPRALAPVEIVPQGPLYDYAARYTAGTTEYFAPARLTDGAAEAVAEYALSAHAALGLADLSRTDMIVDADGVPWFLEVNVATGLTETSLLPQGAEACGVSIGDLYADLALAARRRGSRQG